MKAAQSMPQFVYGCTQCYAHAAELWPELVSQLLSAQQPDPYQLLVGLEILENFVGFQN